MNLPRVFETTRWSLVALVKAGDRNAARDALEHLLKIYINALRSHLLFQHHLSEDQADDLLAGFITDKIVEKNLVGQADKTKGKFRNYILVSLNNYVITKARRDQAQIRVVENAASLQTSGTEPITTDVQSMIYDIEWARALIDETLFRMKEECEGCGNQAVWGIFEARVINPILHGAEVTGYKKLSAMYGYSSPTQASNALVTAKRTFARTLRAVIAEYTESEKIEEEILELRRVLGSQSVI